MRILMHMIDQQNAIEELAGESHLQQMRSRRIFALNSVFCYFL